MYKRQSILSSICFAAFISTANLYAGTFGVSVNGTCDAGSRPAEALAPNSSSSLSVDFFITLADGDESLRRTDIVPKATRPPSTTPFAFLIKIGSLYMGKEISLPVDSSTSL